VHDVNKGAGCTDEPERSDAAFFRAHGDCFIPLPNARSGWGTGQLRGPALSGLLARAVERVADEEELSDRGLRPARWSLDLFRAAPMRPSTIRTTVVRRGRRLCVVDATFEQEGETYARASALFFADADDATGSVWARSERLEPPPPDLAPSDVDAQLMHTPATGWVPDVLSIPHGAIRRQSWHRAVPIVEGERPSSFQLLAAAADFANVIVNWGEQGLEYINADLTVVLSRLPRGGEVGLRSSLRSESGGVAVGAAEIFDRDGVLGVASLTAVANVRHAVDPRRKAPMRLAGSPA
jgi:hypothetical protein